ncbi:diacylglycerol/lipid kinase family protein [Actinophytocola sp.]|uniref:diacylglycerol/lipid kinase family protein n=1 Tax=Actinophytocola sp. TaxID=1872138 RepID=UPI003D6C294D
MIRVVANPRAGGYSDALAAEVVRRCRRSPVGSTVDLVVVVGGDGTAGRVAAALGSSPMFVVPAGTANSFYRTLWGSTPWRTALDLALAGAPAVRVDLARVAELDRLVLSGAGTGFAPRAIHEAKTSGVPYTAALARLVDRYRPYPGRVLVDGVVVHSGPTLLANVGGGRYRGGAYELLPHSVLDDGLLDVCVLGAEHDARRMLTLTRTGAHVDVPGVVYARGRRIRVERVDRRPLWFEHDGEVVTRSRAGFTLTAVPAAVSVVAPPARAVAA